MDRTAFKIKRCPMRLKNIAEIKTNFPEADFWLLRRGDENTIGKPTKNFSEYHIGIKVNRDVIVPDYLYYAIIHLHQNGFFKQFASGVTKLQHLQIHDVKNIKIGE